MTEERVVYILAFIGLAALVVATYEGVKFIFKILLGVAGYV